MTANGLEKQASLRRKTWGFLRNIGIACAFMVVAILLSAFNARHTCAPLVREEVGLPHHSTRFILYPHRHIAEWGDQRAKPGWMVIYAEKKGPFTGVGFQVGVFGRVLGEGTPRIVTEWRQQCEKALDRFTKAFAQLDGAVDVGMEFSNVFAVLGQPIAVDTNSDQTVSGLWMYEPPRGVGTNWVTNGFSLVSSNGIVIKKGHSYVTR